MLVNGKILLQLLTALRGQQTKDNVFYENKNSPFLEFHKELMKKGILCDKKAPKKRYFFTRMNPY